MVLTPTALASQPLAGRALLPSRDCSTSAEIARFQDVGWHHRLTANEAVTREFL